MLAHFPRRADAALFVGLSLAAAGLSIAAIAGSSAHIGRVFPGFIVWDNLVVVALGRPGWSGIAAEVPFRSRVVTVDDHTVRSRRELTAWLEAQPVGTVHAYAFETVEGREARAVPSMIFTLGDYVATMGVYALNGLVFLVAGLAVFYLKPESRQARALLAFGVVYGLMAVVCVDLFTAGRLDPVYFIVQGLCPAALFHLALTFPEPRRPVKRSGRMLGWLYGAGLAAGVLEVALYRRSYPTLLAVDEVIWLVAAAAGLVAMTSLALSALHAESLLARQRARVVLAGAVGAFLLPLVALVVFFVFEKGVSTSILVSTGFVFPLAIAYSVARHDLFDADRFVKRSLVYATLTAVVSLLYGGTVLLAGRLAAGLALTQSPLFPITFVLLALATIVPLRDRVQRAVDRLLYRSRVDYKQTVARASERMTTLLDGPSIVAHVLSTLRDVLFVEGATVWERDGHRLVCRGGPLAAGAPHQLAVDDPGPALLEARQRLVSRDEVEESPRLRDQRAALRALFTALGAELLVPLLRQGRLAGLLAVGRKASGAPFGADDVDVLRTLANETAVALGNALAIVQLQEARERLGRAEGLATIGELSAAVAHGIRNPLAGIRLATQLALENAAPGDPVRENLEDILTEVDTLEAQVRGILDFARPFEPHLEPTDLRALIASLVQALSPGLVAKGVSVEFGTPAQLPLVQADAAHLRQALEELIVNAAEAMAEGGRITITASAAANGVPRVRLGVADTGPGVPAELRERIFQLFMTTKRRGTGVGLAVVRKIVERHGGTIVLEASEPGGARFVLDLPTVQDATT